RFLQVLRPGGTGATRAAGRRVVQLPDGFVAPVVRPALGEDALSLALRAWRTERARAEAMPPYVIAHDTTLIAIAEARPRTLSALRRVKGMGPQKVEKYGEELLSVIEAAGSDG